MLGLRWPKIAEDGQLKSKKRTTYEIAAGIRARVGGCLEQEFRDLDWKDWIRGSTRVAPAFGRGGGDRYIAVGHLVACR